MLNYRRFYLWNIVTGRVYGDCESTKECIRVYNRVLANELPHLYWVREDTLATIELF